LQAQAGDMLKRIVPVIVLLSLASGAEAQQRRPDPGCGRDVSRLCRAVVNESDGVILNCLQQNRAKLSKACAKVLTDNGQ
jgi:hypothetical protein